MTRLSLTALVVAIWTNGTIVTTRAQTPPMSTPAGTQLAYRLETLAAAEDLKKRFSPEQRAVLELLNRADATRLPTLPVLVVPQSWPVDPLAYSPFPTRYDTWRPDTPQLLVVDQAAQAFAAYEYGVQVRWGPVNSGRQTMQTPAGLFHLNWRSRGRHSTVNRNWYMPWNFNFHNTQGLSFHQYALPGGPASHACIRLLERDARWLFNWGETWTLDERGWAVLDPGTPVLILNCYDFDQAPPWRSLEWLASGVSLPAQPKLAVRDCPSR